MFGHRQIKHYSAYKKNQHVHLGFKGDVHFNFTCQKSGYILPPFLVTKKVGSINRLPIFPLFTAFSKISMAGRDFSLGSWTTNMSAITLPFLQPQKHWTGEFIKVFYINWSLFTVPPFTMWMQTIQVCGELEGNQVLTPRTKFLDFQKTSVPVSGWIIVLPVSKALYNSLITLHFLLPVKS